MKKLFWLLLISVVAIAVYLHFFSLNNADRIFETELGYPMGGQSDEEIVHSGFRLAYHCEHKLTNWAAHWLDKNRLEKVKTSKDREEYKPDPKADCQTAESTDYQKLYRMYNGRYNRGHLVPYRDMEFSLETEKEANYYSNIVPQNSDLNREKWNHLEKNVRIFAEDNQTVYIITGCILNSNDLPKISGSQVSIPRKLYKVLLCKENENWHGIAFIFPNENVRGPLADYATTISELEKEADLLFAPKLPREIQNGTKHRFDSQFWATVLKDD